MSRPVTRACVQPKADGPVQSNTGDILLRAFTDLRDELVSTLCFLLGNAEDAQDVAQEAFLRCWRTQESLPDVQNVRYFSVAGQCDHRRAAPSECQAGSPLRCP